MNLHQFRAANWSRATEYDNTTANHTFICDSLRMRCCGCFLSFFLLPTISLFHHRQWISTTVIFLLRQIWKEERKGEKSLNEPAMRVVRAYMPQRTFHIPYPIEHLSQEIMLMLHTRNIAEHI